MPLREPSTCVVPMRSLACLLLVSALLSGCSGTPSPAPDNAPLDASPSDAGTAAAGNGAGDQPASDAPAPPAAGGAAADARPAPATPTLKVLQVDVDGRLASSAGAPDEGMVGPNGGPFGEMDRWFRHDVPGTLAGFDLTMTWTPSPGASTALILTVSEVEGEGEDERMAGERREAEGEGPLRLQAGDLGWDQGKYTVAAWWGGDVAHTPLGQEFHIEGTITYLE